MLSVGEKDVVEVEVAPWEPGEYGVARRTKDGREGADPIGRKSEATPIVRRNTSDDVHLAARE